MKALPQPSTEVPKDFMPKYFTDGGLKPKKDKKTGFVSMLSCYETNYVKRVACTTFVPQSSLPHSQNTWSSPTSLSHSLKDQVTHCSPTWAPLKWIWCLFLEMRVNSDLSFWIDSICPSNGCWLNNIPTPGEKIKETIFWLLRNSEALPSFCS